MSGANPADVFLQEAQELLEQLEQALLDLATRPADGALVDSAFRALHTIKGSGGMFGFEAVAAFTHHVETIFDRVRRGEARASPELIAVALRAKDHIRTLIQAPGTADAADARAILDDLAAAVRAPIASPASKDWRIRMGLPVDAMSLGTNPLLLLDELRGLGPLDVSAHLGNLPPLQALVPSDCHVFWTLRLRTTRPRSAIEEVFLFVIDDMELVIEPDGTAATAPPAALPTVPPPQRAASPSLSPAAATPERPPTGPEARAKLSSDSVRVPAERLDDLMDRVGELVIAQSRLRQVADASGDPQVKAVAEDIERLALELRDSTMGVRTVPIASLFGRYRRLVHDLSLELGKDIELVTVGEETELDKTVIEKLNDPLVHLLRNAIDHGLEQPDARLSSGKPRAGRITLSARHAGAQVVVSIADDGRGLDRDRIRARADELGLIAANATPADAELFQVIFEPGFSTAREVTSLSGRGVGMDVVKRAIETLRGKIEITSIAGRGTELVLRLPLTLAIIDGLLVRVGHGRYVLPLSSVEECVELSEEQDARSHGRNFLDIRGDLVAFLRLRDLFLVARPPDRYQKVVIVSWGKTRVGLVVDQVIGNHQTVIKSLSRLHADVQMFSGATILGDGAVALILDVAQLVDFAQSSGRHLREAV